MLIRSPEDLRRHRGLLHHTHAFLGSPDIPQRNLTNELKQTEAGYQATAPGFLALNQQYQPLYTQLGLGTLGTQLQGFTDPTTGAHVPGTTELDQGVNTSNRIANTADLATIGPAVTGSILNSNPFLANSTANSSSLLDQLTKDATSQLSLNGAASPSQIRAEDQSTLADFANAGNAQGSSAIASQLLNRDAAVQARKAQAEQFASGVAGQNVAAGNSYSSNFTAPLLQILGLGNITPGQNSSGTGTTGSGISDANNLFPQQSPFLNDIFSSNQNAAASSSIAGANNNAALGSSIISLFGQLFSDRRLKKKIRPTGKTTPEGIPMFRFVHKTDPHEREWEGVMAGDVERVRPDAVETDPVSGLKKVDYRRIGVPMTLMEKLAA